MVRHKSGCCSKGLGNWIVPLIDFTNTREKLNLDLYGELPESEQAQHHIELLETVWNRKKHEKGNNVLLKTLFIAFRRDYISLMFWNTLQTVLSVTSPFIIKLFINYIESGENAIKDYIQFWDLSNSEYFKWLTKPKQYGFFLALVLVLS